MEITSKIYMDSQEVIENDDVREYKQRFNYIEGRWFVNFVGFILHPEGSIVSFPKKYFPININNNENIAKREHVYYQDASNLLKALFKVEKERDAERKTLENTIIPEEHLGNFPIVAYQSVCDYFLKFGIYNKSITKSVENFGGNIDWPKTIRSSEVIFSGGNFLFLPFYVKQKDYLHVFISECMKYVLTDGYQRFGNFFDFGVNYQHSSSNPLMKDNERVVRELKLAQAEHFKDSDLRWLSHSERATCLHLQSHLYPVLEPRISVLRATLSGLVFRSCGGEAAVAGLRRSRRSYPLVPGFRLKLFLHLMESSPSITIS